jgi:hypothetical protein
MTLLGFKTILTLSISSWGGTGRFTFARLSSVVMLQERPHFYDRHIAMLLELEVGNAGRIVNTGTSSVNSEFVTALNT